MVKMCVFLRSQSTGSSFIYLCTLCCSTLEKKDSIEPGLRLSTVTPDRRVLPFHMSWLPEDKKANLWHGRGNGCGSWSLAFPRSLGWMLESWRGIIKGSCRRFFSFFHDFTREWNFGNALVLYHHKCWKMSRVQR